MLRIEFLAIAGALSLCCGSAQTAYAGGGDSSFSFGNNAASTLARASSGLDFRTKRVVLRSDTIADTMTEATPGYIKGSSQAGNHVQLTATNDPNCAPGDGRIQYDQSSEARSKIYAKGGNLLIKSRARNHLRILVDGDLVLTSDQLAIAQGRHTALGSQASAFALTNTSFAAKGYVRLDNGNVAQTSVTVKN